MYSGGYYLIYLSLNPNDSDKLEPLFCLLIRSTSGLKIESALWFLPAMFLTTVLYRLLDECIKKRSTLNFSIVFLSIVGCLCSSAFGIRLLWGFDSSLAAMLFYHFGVLIRKHKTLDEIEKRFDKKYKYSVMIISSLVINAILIFTNGDLNMRQGRWGFIPLTYINGIVGVLICWILARRVCQMNNLVISWACRVSQLSIIYVCTNHIVIRYAERLTGVVLNILEYHNYAVQELMVFALTMLVIGLVSEVIIYTPLRIIIGKT